MLSLQRYYKQCSLCWKDVNKRKMSKIELIQGDCLERMKDIPDGSVDMVLTDPPYGTTACKWDSVIPFEPMWRQLKRIIKPNGAIVMTASQPFTTTLISSNMKMFRYEMVWAKNRGTGIFKAKKMPLKSHENILIFYEKLPTYIPQMTEGKPYTCRQGKQSKAFGLDTGKEIVTINKGERYPLTVHSFKSTNGKNIHPTQKPVALMEYLIKTYTNEGETVLDFAMGSFTTAIACLNTKRSFIGIEKDEHYFQVGKDRLEKHLLTLDYTPIIIYNQV